MSAKKCIILSKSATIGAMFQGYDYETIVLSESTAFTAILNSIPADLVVIDDIENGRSLLPVVLSLSKIPEKITLRDDIEDASMDEKKIIHVKTITSESVWGEIIQQNNRLEEQLVENVSDLKKDKILVIDDVVELIDMYKIMFEIK
jgi:hypothetical protein